MLQEKSADEVADGQTVGSGGFEGVVGGDHAPCARHVLDDHDRVAGNMFTHMPADGARIGIITAAGGEADDEPNGFSLVKVGLSVRRFPVTARDGHET